MAVKSSTVERHIAICRTELCERLIPHIHSTLTKHDSAAALVQALLNDPLCAVAFGYRFPRQVREDLVARLTEETTGGESVPPGRTFQSTILHRAIVYMKFVRIVFKILDYPDHLKMAHEIVEALEKVSPDKYNTAEQLARFVDTQVRADGADDAVVRRALDDGGRMYFDRTADAALWLLTTKTLDVLQGDSGAKLIDLLCEHLRLLVEAHRTPGGKRMSDPATLYWALVELLEHGRGTAAWCNGVLRDLVAHKELTELVRTHRDTDLETAPELFEGLWRSDAFSVFDLAKLQKVDGIDCSLIDTLIAPPLERMLDFKLQPPRRNLHFVAQRLLALETHAPPKSKPAGCVPDFGFEKTVQYVTEINLADYRVMGDYLVWRDAPTVKTPLEDEIAALQKSIETYIDAGPQRPMNILLWSPPGSGKSFFVKNVLKTDKLKGLAPTLVELNAAQLSRPEDLIVTLRRVTSKIAESGRAAFFLDEADTDLPGPVKQQLWPYLLMPMWDGEYLSDGQALNMKQLVWFFAVSGTNFENVTKGAPKGQDFLSRLHRRLTLPGLDERSQVLIFIGTLLRLHKKARPLLVERGALRHVAATDFSDLGGARMIEKAVMLLPLRNKNEVHAKDVLEGMPGPARPNVTIDLDDGQSRELVAIVDL